MSSTLDNIRLLATSIICCMDGSIQDYISWHQPLLQPSRSNYSVFSFVIFKVTYQPADPCLLEATSRHPCLNFRIEVSIYT
ncbi:hypothetical protein T10_310 [Trichinella papuae]|uniref:Uncharacterized protein n=1 Tax=Trichinella papuae TaxID=268474 RepID=A0A0V1N181_9BILA|nr:hypothetical protein T10_310 [Trichinella papuae]